MSIINFPPSGWLTGKGEPTLNGIERQFYYDELSQKVYIFFGGIWSLLSTFGGFTENIVTLFDDFYTSTGITSVGSRIFYSALGSPAIASFLFSDSWSSDAIGLRKLSTSTNQYLNFGGGTLTSPLGILDRTTFFLPNVGFKATYETRVARETSNINHGKLFIGLINSGVNTGSPLVAYPYTSNYQHIGISFNDAASLGNICFSKKLSLFGSTPDVITPIKTITSREFNKVKIVLLRMQENPNLVTIVVYLNDIAVGGATLTSSGATGLSLIHSFAGTDSTLQVCYTDWEFLKIERIL